MRLFHGPIFLPKQKKKKFKNLEAKLSKWSSFAVFQYGEHERQYKKQKGSKKNTTTPRQPWGPEIPPHHFCGGLNFYPVQKEKLKKRKGKKK